MKKLFGLFFIGLFVTVNINAQDIYAQKKDALIGGDYDSFKIMDMQERAKTGSMEAVVVEGEYVQGLLVYADPAFPSPEVKAAIAHAIKHEFISQDYDMKMESPDLLVTYLVYSKDGKLKGEFRDPKYPGIDENTDRNNVYDVKKGSLLISAIDTKTGQTVWSGFSNGTFTGMKEIMEKDVIRAVTNILGQLNVE